MDGGGVVWFDGEQWLSRERSARLWRELTGMPVSGKTWGRMAERGELDAMGIRTQDEGKLTHKMDIVAWLEQNLTDSLARVKAERDVERAEMDRRRGDE